MIRFTSLDCEVPDDDLTNSPYQRLELKELAEHLAALPERFRESLLAREGVHPEGLSCRKLGERLGKRGQTICNWAAKAEQLIRERYGEDDEFA